MTLSYDTHVFQKLQGTDLHLHIYQANHDLKSKTIIYIHGGGFVYGSSHDLPEAYIRQITEAGYHLILLEYPLAPEVKLGQILASVETGISWFLEHAIDKLGLTSTNYILFGRSAGAYLAVTAAHRMPVKPDALWLFYGYYTLQEATFRVPSRHYLQFPRVDERLVKQSTRSGLLVEGPKEKRFALYIYYRQSGQWVADILTASEKPTDYSLTKDQLAALPPTFLTASTGDPDVPYRLSKMMAQTIPDTVLETIHSNEHDFDRTTTETVGRDVYAKALAWLKDK